MKKISLLVIVACCTISAWSQNSIPMLGMTAPSFTAETTNGKIEFPKDFGNSWKILFSHPKDFTPVCTSEILALTKMQDEFDKLNVKIAIISVDDLASHNAWKQYMEGILLDSKDSVKISFPLIADNNLRVSNMYGMVHSWENQTRDVRGVFIINPENIIQSISFYPNNIGRNMEEIKRVIVALQTSEKEQVMTPANWKYGDDVLMKYQPYTESELLENPDLKNQYYKVGINMWYKRVSTH
jgi:peroxiredoxin (alkyl hydroperoxide reductase subunit C)